MEKEKGVALLLCLLADLLLVILLAVWLFPVKLNLIQRYYYLWFSYPSILCFRIIQSQRMLLIFWTRRNPVLFVR